MWKISLSLQLVSCKLLTLADANAHKRIVYPQLSGVIQNIFIYVIDPVSTRYLIFVMSLLVLATSVIAVFLILHPSPGG